jgi:hypothetical protein
MGVLAEERLRHELRLIGGEHRLKTKLLENGHFFQQQPPILGNPIRRQVGSDLWVREEGPGCGHVRAIVVPGASDSRNMDRTPFCQDPDIYIYSSVLLQSRSDLNVVAKFIQIADGIVEDESLVRRRRGGSQCWFYHK